MDEIDFGKECDLHHFHPRDTRLVVEAFLRQSAERGYRRVRLVHGKGRSAKKEHVYRILKEHPRVIRYYNDGPNWGATIIELSPE